MNIMHIDFESSSTLNTEQFAEQLGQKLRGGEILELVSDLGGGKTTFVRGLARGFGSKDIVRSPSFALSNQYKSNDLTMYHFDFYRLDDPGIIANELDEITSDPKAIIVIEWAAIVEHVITVPHLIVQLKYTGDSERDIEIEYPKVYNYLFESHA
jgi:tRNA threonylcarbamoyladenosine biosynthesis protein TsaE